MNGFMEGIVTTFLKCLRNFRSPSNFFRARSDEMLVYKYFDGTVHN